MKTFKFPLISLSLVVVLSACNFPGISSPPTQITAQAPTEPVATMTLHVNPTQTETAMITSTGTALPISRPDTPVWSVYDYTCELTSGGATMTMNLTWTDHSNGEEGYKIYRDGKVIATLAPNSTSYIDVAFVATGKTLSYSVEAFNADWQVSTSTITHGCQ